MTAVADGIDGLFADPNIARDAVWRAGGSGAGEDVRIVWRRPDQLAEFGAGRFVTPGHLLDVRISEIAELQPGDTFEIGGTTYVVDGEPLRDAERVVWSAQVRPE